VRKIRFFQPDGYFSIDFLEQQVTIARRVRSPQGGDPTVDIQPLEIDRGDALATQLDAFLRALGTRKVSEGAGQQALAALRTALRVVDAMPPLRIPDADDLRRGG
jgi:hypothetical protein